MKKSERKINSTHSKFEYNNRTAKVEYMTFKGEKSPRTAHLNYGTHIICDCEQSEWPRISSRVQKNVKQLFYNYLTVNGYDNVNYMLQVDFPGIKKKDGSSYVELVVMVINKFGDDVEKNNEIFLEVIEVFINELAKYSENFLEKRLKNISL